MGSSVFGARGSWGVLGVEGTRPQKRTGGKVGAAGEARPILGINCGKIVEKCLKNAGKWRFICVTLQFFAAQFQMIFGLGSQESFHFAARVARHSS